MFLPLVLIGGAAVGAWLLADERKDATPVTSPETPVAKAPKVFERGGKWFASIEGKLKSFASESDARAAAAPVAPEPKKDEVAS